MNEGKERLLEAAKRSIAAHGIEGATMRGIAEEAGLSTGAIYHYYAKKEDILYDVMAGSLGEAKRIADETKRGGTGPSEVLEDIVLNIRKRFDKADDNRIQFYLAVEAMLGNETLRGRFADKYGEWVDRIEELMDFLYEGKPGPHRRALVALLLGAIEGAVLQILVGANPASADDMARVYGVLLKETLPGLAARMAELDAETGKADPGGSGPEGSGRRAEEGDAS